MKKESDEVYKILSIVNAIARSLDIDVCEFCSQLGPQLVQDLSWDENHWHDEGCPAREG